MTIKNVGWHLAFGHWFLVTGLSMKRTLGFFCKINSYSAFLCPFWLNFKPCRKNKQKKLWKEIGRFQIPTSKLVADMWWRRYISSIFYWWSNLGIDSITAKPYISQKSSIQWICSKFFVLWHGHNYFWPPWLWRH